MTYINAVKYILSLPCGELSQGDTEVVERIRIICDIFSRPQKKLKFINVCGDVGKDSCLSMLEAILKNTQYKFGRCSVSNTDDPRECISINGKAISHAEFSDLIKDISKIYRTKFKGTTPDRCEVLTLAAIIFFANRGCDVALIERGMRKNDPSSIIDSPLVSLLTPFSDRNIVDGRFEHLIPKGTAETVSSPQHKETYSAISEACVLAGSRLTVPIYGDMEIRSITLFKTEYSYRGEDYSIRSFSPCQTINAITAIETINALSRCGFTIDTNAIKKGLFSANLEGKCETVAIEPTVIVSSSYENERLDTLVASIAQVKDQFSNGIAVYVDNECQIDLSALSESLSAHEIPHNAPIFYSIEQVEGHSKKISSLSSDSAIIFIGKKNYISRVKSALNEQLGF